MRSVSALLLTLQAGMDVFPPSAGDWRLHRAATSGRCIERLIGRAGFIWGAVTCG
jgi:hypothetical protein